MKITDDHRYSRRAVAPIIATLLMVAIAVVGGILIFVFAQGFFTDTNIQTPNIESLEIFGYDARDQANLRPHNADPASTPDSLTSFSAAASNNLKDSDAVVVYARNKGAGPITIEKIKVFGADYVFDTDAGGTCSGSAPGDQEFGLSTAGTTVCKTSAVLEAGQEASIYIAYEETTNGKIKIGRPIPVVIITGNGAAFTKQLQNGVQVG